MTQTVATPAVDLEGLRRAIQAEYALVAQEPEHGFHFLVGRPLAAVLGYAETWLEGIPEPTIASFAARAIRSTSANCNRVSTSSMWVAVASLMVSSRRKWSARPVRWSALT